MERYKNFLLIEVPESAFVYKIYENRILLLNDIVDLPPGNYTIIGKGDELRNIDWESIVDFRMTEPDGRFILWKNYGNTETWFGIAKDSGYSLLKSKNLSPETTLIIQDNQPSK